MLSREVFQTFSDQFQTFFGPVTRPSQLPILVGILDSQNGRFGNRTPQGELRERKLIPPQESVTKFGYSKALFQYIVENLISTTAILEIERPKAKEENVSLFPPQERVTK